jgi:probable blue pigment (indigoidine) exporter
MSPTRLSAWSLVAAAACWGTATAISKRAVDEIAPLALLPIELAISVVVLLVAASVTGDRSLPTLHRRQLAWLGVLNPGVSYALSLAGLARITASASALLWATEPVLILLLAWLVLRQRPDAALLTLAGVALLGVLLVVAQPGIRLSASGVTLTLAGVGACAVYTVLSSRYLGDASTLGVVLLQQGTALAFAVLLGLGALAIGRTAGLGDVSSTAWTSAVVAGALYYGVAFWFYLHGLRTCSPAVAGLFINLVPVFGIAAATVLLDERFTGRQWVGGALALLAVTAVAVVHDRSADADDETRTLANSPALPDDSFG